MILHCYRHYEGKEAFGSPFIMTMRQLGATIRVFVPAIRLGWAQSRWRVWFVDYPRLLWFGFSAGLRSFFSTPRADVIVAWSHLVLIPLAILKIIFFRREPRLVLVGFIYTPRRSFVHRLLRYLYFKTLLAQVSLVVVHSRHEAEHYPKVFGLERSRFVFIPFGDHIGHWPQPTEAERYVFSAGRSCRDYPLLLRVAAKLPIPFRIACDNLGDASCPPNVRVLRNCWGDDLLREMVSAVRVVIPLDHDGLSAGQMVLIQGMALGKPVIITRTRTTEEYVEDRKTAFLVRLHSEEDLLEAIEYLLQRPDVAQTIGANAARTYREKYTMEASTRCLFHCLSELVRRPGRLAAQEGGGGASSPLLREPGTAGP